ncbi:hypothetical protein NLJ89_g2519 [Agrocybe chaxingu]|uniref:Senescence domain-containing protein n=1 Tax=Agrocybe chaxingu TaxID=84603 RepID=A0A9W8K6M9_9AGAR|nr:hypothetical protein NLJ89_g2519 [Agrocybe chaxingu]
MQNAPEAFVLFSFPKASLTVAAATQTGPLSLECVTVPIPESANAQDRDVYLVLRLNATETVIDPARVVKRTDGSGFRTYTFAATQADPSELFLMLQLDSSNAELVDKVDTFESILDQYVAEFQGLPARSSPALPPAQMAGLGVTRGNKDLRGHLVMINEETGEVIGEVEDRFRIREDPIMNEKGHETDPVIIEVPEESTRESDANALEVFARIVPPDQQNWMTKSASIASHAISMSTNLLLTTITTASSFYISHSQPSPHHSTAGTPARATSPGAPPPLPPRALVFLTSEKTRKGLSTVHTMSGEAVKISSKTVGVIDNLIRRAMGAKTKRTKYFTTGVPASGEAPTPGLLSPNPTGPPLTPRSKSPSPSPISLSPSYFRGSEKPPLPRRSTSPGPPPLPPRSPTAPVEGSATPLQPRLTTKDRLLISADLILSTIDDSTRRLLDTGTEQLGRVVGHKYGAEAAQSSLLMAGTARNVGLVYVDMRGIGRRALLKRTAHTFVKARVSSNKPAYTPSQPPVSPVHAGKQE